MSGTKIKILLADDHPLVRTGLMKLLDQQREFSIVGEAGDGEEAIELTKRLRPDVVVIDVSMPKMTGIEATKIIRERFPDVKVLVLTMHDNEEYIYQILRAGAGGYVLKNSGREDLIAAITAVSKGENFFSPRVSEVMLKGYLKKAERRDAPPSSDDLPLTKREREILLLIADGKNNARIAEKLFISPRTVETHRTNIMQKLNIHDAPNLVRFAIEQKSRLLKS